MHRTGAEAYALLFQFHTNTLLTVISFIACILTESKKYLRYKMTAISMSPNTYLLTSLVTDFSRTLYSTEREYHGDGWQGGLGIVAAAHDPSRDALVHRHRTRRESREAVVGGEGVDMSYEVRLFTAGNYIAVWT